MPCKIRARLQPQTVDLSVLLQGFGVVKALESQPGDSNNKVRTTQPHDPPAVPGSPIMGSQHLKVCPCCSLISRASLPIAESCQQESLSPASTCQLR